MMNIFILSQIVPLIYRPAGTWFRRLDLICYLVPQGLIQKVKTKSYLNYRPVGTRHMIFFHNP